MKFYNVIDELGRYCGLKVDLTGDGQYDSHTCSYLYERQQYKKLGDIMGLDALIMEELK